MRFVAQPLLLVILLWSAPSLGAGRSTSFEQKDLLGSTTQFLLTVGTSPQSVPTTPTTVIAEAMVRCPFQTPFSTRRCLVAFDNSTNWVTLRPGEFIAWPVKGYKKQITVQAATAGTTIEVILNREP